MKALRANELYSDWNLFETSPQTILSEIDRKAGGETFVTKPATAANADAAKQKEQVVELMLKARLAIEAGKLDVAKQKALEAQKFNVTYGKYDDRPDLVLADINRLESSLSFNAFNPNPTDPQALQNSSKYLNARKLLADARQLLIDNKLEEAKAKALEAEQLDVVYEINDDRPDAVLLEISRRIARANGETPGAGAASLSASQFGQLDEIANALASKNEFGQKQATTNNPPAENPFFQQAQEQTESDNQAGEVALTQIQRIGYEEESTENDSNPFQPVDFGAQEINTVVPEGLTATQWFDHGVKLMQNGDRDQALPGIRKSLQIW
ncbi:MAG: hypothetical protein R3C11_09120 [Planctomycetaceae bacterium]